MSTKKITEFMEVAKAEPLRKCAPRASKRRKHQQERKKACSARAMKVAQIRTPPKSLKQRAVQRHDSLMARVREISARPKPIQFLRAHALMVRLSPAGKTDEQIEEADEGVEFLMEEIKHYDAACDRMERALARFGYTPAGE